MLRKVLPLILLVVASAMAHADKVSGFVKGSPTGKTFVVGAKAGTFTVDASKARVTLKGKFFSLAKLTGGSQVTVEGTKKGNNIMATSVAIGMVRGATPTTKPAAKPMSKPAAKPVVKGGAKPMAKPMSKPAAKPAAKPAMKGGAKPAAKPASTAKPKDNSKAKAKAPVAKAKTDSKDKAKTK